MIVDELIQGIDEVPHVETIDGVKNMMTIQWAALYFLVPAFIVFVIVYGIYRRKCRKKNKDDKKKHAKKLAKAQAKKEDAFIDEIEKRSSELEKEDKGNNRDRGKTEIYTEKIDLVFDDYGRIIGNGEEEY